MSLLSVVVTTHNRRPVLQQCLQALLDSSEREALAEVVVVDDGSQDDTAEYLGSLESPVPLTRVRLEQPAGPATARNRGVARARADFIWLLDDDVAVEPGAAGHFLNHIRAHPMDSASAVGFVEQVDEQRTAFETYLFSGGPQFIQCRIQPEAHLDAGEDQFCTANLVSPTEVLRRHPFRETFRFPRYEDRELGYRLARAIDHKIHYVPEARGIHLKRYRFRDWLRAYTLFTEAALHFAGLYPEDEQLWQRLGIRRAEQTDRFSLATLQQAVGVVNRAQTGPELYQAYWDLQEFHRQTAYRHHLGLPGACDPEGPVPASVAVEQIYSALREDV